MKHISEYLIDESLSTKQRELIVDIFNKIFKGTQFTKEQIFKVLVNLDKDMIQVISHSYTENDQKNYLPYSPSDDDFINYNENSDKILQNISEYISKFLI